MVKYGLLGFPLTHSFSKDYYDRKIERESLKGVEYHLFSLSTLAEFRQLLRNDGQLGGVNVTIPHKVGVMALLDGTSATAKAVGAVNCIRIERADQDGEPLLFGDNTDVHGFETSLKPLLAPQHNRALVLGTGGASRAVCYVLQRLQIPFVVVSRTPEIADGTTPPQLSYADLTPEVIADHRLIINTTPLGMFPNIEEYPAIPYEGVGLEHLLYDLVYNPAITAFLRKGAAQGGAIKNGLEMLELQAEKNWEIWTTT